LKRDFLVLSDFTLAEHRQLIERARAVKQARREHKEEYTLRGMTLGLLFEKPSTRTRVSFEAAMFQLGGAALALPLQDSQLKRGETVEDTARVLSRYCDALVFRTFADERLAAFARASTVPVINGLSEGAHPVQLLADLMTVEERFGDLQGRRIAFIGDGASNMARSWIEAAEIFDLQLALAAPPGYQPSFLETSKAKDRVRVLSDRHEAANGAEVLCTDVWTSMGDEVEAERRRTDLRPYFIDESLLAAADPRCIVLHCLPAHRGEEITAGVIDGPSSAVFDEAENRLHVQKALLEKLLLSA
jgi:ornithine carbamoyltransferase